MAGLVLPFFGAACINQLRIGWRRLAILPYWLVRARAIVGIKATMSR